MALVIKKIERLEHPTEPGAWVTVRLPLSAGDLESMRADGNRVAVSLDLLAAMIQEWSYGVPVTLEAVRSLDLDTFQWLSKEVQERSGIRTEEEKNASGASSPAISERAAAPSPVSSGI